MIGVFRRIGGRVSGIVGAGSCARVLVAVNELRCAPTLLRGERFGPQLRGRAASALVRRCLIPPVVGRRTSGVRSTEPPVLGSHRTHPVPVFRDGC